MTNTFRVVAAHKTVISDAGFVSRVPVYVVANQNGHVYASFWGNPGGHLSALSCRDRLSPTMQPPALGGQLGSGYTVASQVGPSGEHCAAPLDSKTGEYQKPLEECGRCGSARPTDEFQGGVCADCAFDFYCERMEEDEQC